MSKDIVPAGPASHESSMKPDPLGQGISRHTHMQPALVLCYQGNSLAMFGHVGAASGCLWSTVDRQSMGQEGLLAKKGSR